VPIIGVISIRVVQANVNAETDPVILWIPPACIHDLICIGRGIDGAIGDTKVYAIVAVIPDPITEAIGPVSA
jgi:hypothetical protein